MYCPKCGKMIGEESVFCQYCGVQLGAAGPQVVNVVNNVYQRDLISEKNKWVAFVLCLILGVIGIHRFYVGKIGTGVLWLFTGGMFGIGWLVDLIMIVTDNFRDGYGDYLC